MIESHPGEKEPTRTLKGFGFVDMSFSITSMGTGRAYLTERYPEVGYNELASDMFVTILLGSVYLFFESGASERLSKWDTVCIPKGTKYYWIPDSREAILQVTNSPPYEEQEA
jgi:hypothetical protein